MSKYPPLPLASTSALRVAPSPPASSSSSLLDSPTPPPSPSPALPRKTMIWKKKGILYGLDLNEDPFPDNPNFVVLLLLLVLTGVRPHQLAERLRTEDPLVVWREFRDHNVSRWATLSVISGLMLSATGTVMQLGPSSSSCNAAVTGIHHLPTTLALGGRCSALIAAGYATSLSLIFGQGSPKDFARLAQQPVVMVLILGGPAFFAIIALTLFFRSLVTDAWVAGTIADQIVATTFASTIVCVLLFSSFIGFEILHTHMHTS